jgi:hypothetical protein
MKTARKGKLLVMPARRAMTEPEPAEITCPWCRSEDVIVLESDKRTGVVAPDGGPEYRLEWAYECLACGHFEEA